MRKQIAVAIIAPTRKGRAQKLLVSYREVEYLCKHIQLTENKFKVIAPHGSSLQPNSARINLGRLFRWLFLTLILPMTLAVAFDYLLNLQPFITILATVIVIPLATFFVVRIVIDEMNQLLVKIVPQEVVFEESISPSFQKVETV